MVSWSSFCARGRAAAPAIAGAVLAAMIVLGSAIEVVAQGHGHVKDELLVGFRHGVTGSKARAVYRALGGDSLEEIPQINVHRIRVPAHALEKVKQALSHRPEVEFVEENAILPLQQLTDDPRLAEQWHHFKIGAIQAWDVTPGDGAVIIAILDSGVDAAHPDLASRLVAGYSPYDGTTNTSDHFGHGTKVAGTAAAAGDNATGVAGVAWNTRIMPIRVSDTSGYAYYSTIASGITWAVDRGARVLNISINGVAASSSITSAARYAVSKGAVVVAAAGNCGCVESTASNPYLISVSATTSTDSVASWSSRGDHVDVAAPGSGILTTTRGGGYGSVSGTSFASPVTAGVVALMLSANPGLQPSEVEQILKATALDLGASGWDPSYGAGRVDALRAVVAAAETSPPADVTPPSVRIVAPANGSTAAGSLTVDASVSDDV
ncbi:MAG TPA: S8 family serine peptidase, partial [Candidatus Tectomicrobia bacterium]|nr:S8 family serine peptidase [Candidatus Tectomicrobia bacterium]